MKNDDAYRARIEREAAFHDHSYSTDLRPDAVGKFYTIAESSYEDYRRRVFENVDGRRVLEYGCGINSHGTDLVRAGADVVGIDISPVAIEESQRVAEEQGLGDRIAYHVMNAEELTFEADSFDLVCGIGILHHLDTELAAAEIARVLRPGARGIFHEPLGHNPVFNRFRDRTPELRTPDEHPLLKEDFRMMRRHFSTVDVTPYNLGTLAAVPLRSTPLFGPLHTLLRGLDRAMMTVIPPMKWWAWQTVVEIQK